MSFIKPYKVTGGGSRTKACAHESTAIGVARSTAKFVQLHSPSLSDEYKKRLIEDIKIIGPGGILIEWREK